VVRPEDGEGINRNNPCRAGGIVEAKPKPISDFGNLEKICDFTQGKFTSFGGRSGSNKKKKKERHSRELLGKTPKRPS